MAELTAYHEAHADTAAPGYCIDIAHGWVGSDRQVRADHWGLIEAGLPWCRELHLKNTDAMYDKTFGFRADERQKGVIDVAAVRGWLQARAAELPVQELVGYLEIGGPKLGRDYSDPELEPMLRESLQHLKQSWLGDGDRQPATGDRRPATGGQQPAVRIAPSLMCADQCHLESEVRRLESAGCDLLHIDIMDGSFVPNLVLGFEQVKSLRPRTALPLDVHLMVEDNERFVRLAKEAGADMVTVHVESCRHLDRVLALIRELGMKAGAALNPATTIDALTHVVDRLDHVLLMSVNPGFAGQQLVPSALAKIAAARAWLGPSLPIQVDGNVSFAHIPAMVAAGADILVAGSSSVYARGASIADNVARTRAAIADGLLRRASGRYPSVAA